MQALEGPETHRKACPYTEPNAQFVPVSPNIWHRLAGSVVTRWLLEAFQDTTLTNVKCRRQSH